MRRYGLAHKAGFPDPLQGLFIVSLALYRGISILKGHGLDNLRGAILMVLAMAGFAIEDMFIKLAAETLPVGQILIVIGIGGALTYGVWALLRGQPPIAAHMLRGASGLRAVLESMAALCFVTSLALVPLSLVTTIMQAAPLFVTLGAAVFFGMPVGWRRWTAILVGLFGVLIVLRPFGTTFEAAALFAVAGMLAMSGRDLATRRIPSNISTMQLSTIGFLAVIPGGILALVVAGETMIWPTPLAALYLACSVFLGVPALYAIIAANRIGDISFVAPFRYSRIVFGLLGGILVFGETLDTMTLLGAAIIVTSGLYTLLREARLRRASLRTKPAL